MGTQGEDRLGSWAAGRGGLCVRGPLGHSPHHPEHGHLSPPPARKGGRHLHTGMRTGVPSFDPPRQRMRCLQRRNKQRAGRDTAATNRLRVPSRVPGVIRHRARPPPTAPRTELTSDDHRHGGGGGTLRSQRPHRGHSSPRDNDQQPQGASFQKMFQLCVTNSDPGRSEGSRNTGAFQWGCRPPAPGGREQRGDEREVQAVAQGPDGGTPALRMLNRRQLPALGRRADSQDSQRNRASRTEVCVPRDGRLIDK